MGTNIMSWKTKRLENLRIPVSALFEHEREDWHPEWITRDGTTTFTVMESTIAGTVQGGVLEVEEIDICGEGSGTALAWILEPALRKSTGHLLAVCVWEDGEIAEITAADGAVTSETVDL